MDLCADAVILVFYRCAIKVRKRFLGILGRAGQHEANRMEKPHLRLIEFVFRRQPQSFTDIAQQHIGPLYGFHIFIERLGDGLFHQAFTQPMRRSPLMILITYLASSAVARRSRS